MKDIDVATRPASDKAESSPSLISVSAKQEKRYDEGDEYFSQEDDDHYSSWDEQDELELRLANRDGDAFVNDEDWGQSGGDFTKQYNKLRQHMSAIGGGSSQAVAPARNSAAGASTSIAVPASNRPQVAPSHPASRHADQLVNLSSQFASKLSTAAYTAPGAAVNPKSGQGMTRDKSDRATTEQVLDPRTKLILFKMINRGLVSQIDGCVSTGKEANVYHSMSPEGQPLALKIFKTSILVFKDRDRYVTGEFRFRKGYAKSNPRKMVRLWAEKELRNLKRLCDGGIRCPDPIEVRENVLVMGYLGDSEGWPSPRLKDAVIPQDRIQDMYFELVIIMRIIFTKCKLVHADLSEYNILYHEEHLYIIDVSQSVEQDHPFAFDFMRSDIKNVESFFQKSGAETIGLKRLFTFLTHDSHLSNGEKLGLNCCEPEETLLPILQRLVEERRSIPDLLAEEEDQVFYNTFIPRRLTDVFDVERDVAKVTDGKGDELVYAGVVGLEVSAPAASKDQFVVLEENSQSMISKNGSEACQHVKLTEANEDDVECSSSDEDSSSSFDERSDKPQRGHRHEDAESKKERKAATRQEAREKRKTKMPKAVKKAKVKKSKGH